MPRRDAQGNEQRHPLEKVLAEIKRYAGDVWLKLDTVQATIARTFTDQLIDTQPNRLDEVFRTALFARTGGQALFTVELLRSLQERGGLARDEQGRWVVTPDLDWETVPARVEGVLEERLGRLEDAQREMLRAASVEGEQFTVAVVAQVQQLPLRQLVKDLAQHLDKRHHLVREQNELQLGGQRLARYQFVHALFQQFLYQELSTAEQRLLHGEIARSLEQLCTGHTDSVSAQLAWHYDQADEDDKAVDYFIIAGERAFISGAPREANGHFQRALDLLPAQDRQRRWRAVLGREAALTPLGDPAARQADVAALVEMAEAANDDGWRAEAYHRQAQYAQALRDFPLQIQAADQAIAAARRSGQLAWEAQALASKASALSRTLQTEAAQQTFEAALARAYESGDAVCISFVAHRASTHYIACGELERATQVASEAVEMARQVGNRHLEANALHALGRAYQHLTLFDRAKGTLEAAMKLHQALGNRVLYAYAVLNLASVLSGLGEPAVAKTTVEGLENEIVASERFWHAACSLALALIAEQMGDWSTAAPRAQAARALFSQIGSQGYATQCEALLARYALAEDRLDEAERSAAHQWAYLQTHGTIDMGVPFLVCLTCADVFQALGDTDKARAVIEFGYQTLMKYTDRISNIEWRATFLKNLPEHGILIQRWQDLHAKRGVTEA
jgi:predicted ATPase